MSRFLTWSFWLVEVIAFWVSWKTWINSIGSAKRKTSPRAKHSTRSVSPASVRFSLVDKSSLVEIECPSDETARTSCRSRYVRRSSHRTPSCTRWWTPLSTDHFSLFIEDERLFVQLRRNVDTYSTNDREGRHSTRSAIRLPRVEHLPFNTF